MRRKIYLALAAVLVFMLIFIIIVPYLDVYISYHRGLKNFVPGSRVTYRGEINFFITRDENSSIRRVIVDTDLYFILSLRYLRSGYINATLSIFKESSGGIKERIFHRTVLLTNSSDLIKFLLPQNSYTEILKGLINIQVCKYPGPVLTGSTLGMPTRVGVPHEYLGIMVIADRLVVTDMPPWPKSWQRCTLPNLTRVGEFYEYGKLKKGFMLLSYTSYYDTDINGNPIAAKIFQLYGSPLVDILANTFNVKLLKNVIGLVKKDPSLSIRIVRERVILSESNTYPVDQAWLDGIVSAYMSLAPFSQIMTIMIAIFIALYYRER